MSQQQHSNPFADQASIPAVSWANAPVGHTITGRVLEAPSMAQSRDFATDKPATWENGDPKMSVVTQLDVNGEVRSLWCVKPSALYGAIVEALKQSGPGYIEVGGTISVTYTGDKPSSKPGMNPAKQFAVQYQPPNAFGSNGSQQQYAQQQVPQQPAYAQQQPAQQPPAAGPDYPQPPTQQPLQPPF
jgi:hypothetical protein